MAKKLFDQCLRVLGADKTVILVTHQISYLYECDEAIILENGAIKAHGKPNEVRQHL